MWDVIYVFITAIVTQMALREFLKVYLTKITNS